MTEVVPEPFQP
jgi:hypothetical protein